LAVEAHDAERISQSRLDMDGEGLEADSAPLAAGEKGSPAADAQDPQKAGDRRGYPEGQTADLRRGAKIGRREGQGEFRTYPRAGDRPVHDASKSESVEREI
jgi:hypothetical protein